MKIVKISSLILAGGIVLAACGNDDDKSNSKNDNKGVSDSVYKKLDYNKYYSKNDIDDKVNGEYFVDTNKAIDIEKKIVKNTKGATYLGKSKDLFPDSDHSGGKVPKYILDLKGNHLENDAIDFKINKINTYNIDDLLSTHKFGTKQMDGSVSIGDPNSSDSIATEDKKGGVIEVDFEYTNKDSEDMNLAELVQVYANETDGEILNVNGEIDGKKIDTSNSNASTELSMNQVGRNQTFKGKIAYVITQEDINKPKILKGNFKITEPLNDGEYSFKKEIK